MKICSAVEKLAKISLKRKIGREKMSSRSSSSKSDEGPPAKKKHWTLGLLDSMHDPELKVREDDRVTVIKDKYPKSRHHFLVLPKEKIDSIRNLTREHEDLLRHMEKVGREITQEYKDYEFMLGYHAVPSMNRLHLHVISTDFDSPCLQNKYHWNSFTTAFFRPSPSIREELKQHGKITEISSAEKEKLLKRDLMCHKCKYKPKNMPDLKKHLLNHLNTQ